LLSSTTTWSERARPLRDGVTLGIGEQTVAYAAPLVAGCHKKLLNNDDREHASAGVEQVLEQAVPNPPFSSRIQAANTGRFVGLLPEITAGEVIARASGAA
jgi:hypothetical protein